MNQKRFERMMSAVDEDLLEEAQLPLKAQRAARAKRSWVMLAASAAACIAVVAATTFRMPVQTPPDNPQVVNPLKTVTAVEVAALGYRIPLPADAQETAYFLIDAGGEQAAPMAEVRFDRNGGAYTCRALKTTVSEDISGLYVNWSQNYTWRADTLDVTIMEAEDLTACVSWYEEEAGIQWCLSGERGASDLLNTAGDIMNALGYDLGVAPAGAEKVAFRVLELDGLTVGETTFLFDGVSYAYRVASTWAIEENFADISGVEREFAEKTVGEIGWCSARLCFDKDAGGKIVWFDPAPGLLYSLYMETGASEQALFEMAELLYTPAQGDAG